MSHTSPIYPLLDPGHLIGIPPKVVTIQVISPTGNRFQDFLETDLVALYDAEELEKLKAGHYVMRQDGIELHRDIDAFAARQERIARETGEIWDEEIGEHRPYNRTAMNDFYAAWAGPVDFGTKLAIVFCIVGIALLILIK